ncbi:hypothetical protein AXF42_Ash007927 [Apostasia shenzhenica]|uniref:Uncharacterized protein n=1 Tax=Apostasia shenzhenica TaxID=1088818 RepID=A0A2I0B5T9_9ASPA|nr:hypothetical protein AXF42_Ash007927 [Apostasia shenzhenica]
MEGKKSCFDEQFPRKETAEPPKPDILSSTFPPYSAEAGKHSSGSWRKQSDEGQVSCIYGNSKNKRGKNSSAEPVYLCELPETCLMSSSIYYGGRDDFIPESSSRNQKRTNFTYKNDRDDITNNSEVATRGDWWQGSLYY